MLLPYVVRGVLLLFAPLVLVVLLFAASDGRAPPPTATQEGPAKPNFVFILADDMRKDDLKYMPKTTALLGDEGMRFDEAFVSYPMCCPSRATILRGQYAHNHGVWRNDNGSHGGWRAYKNRGHEQDNLATRLHDGGYRTGLFGKYLNDYRGRAVPPGWDDWSAMPDPKYFQYNVNDNGTIKHFGKDEGTIPPRCSVGRAGSSSIPALSGTSLSSPT
jgi:N-acetylglucosamine-6-sulfatase